MSQCSSPVYPGQGRMQVLANGDIVDCARLPHTARNNLYKTELCKHFTETGTCRYGSKCQFAHGREELRGVLRHPKYKTTRCKAFMSTGKCMYGSRCRFIHEDAELSLRNPEEENYDSNSSTSSEPDDHEHNTKNLMVNPYRDLMDPIDLSLPFGGLKQVTLTPLTSIGSTLGSPSPPDFDSYLNDSFGEFKLNEEEETNATAKATGLEAVMSPKVLSPKVLSPKIMAPIGGETASANASPMSSPVLRSGANTPVGSLCGSPCSSPCASPSNSLSRLSVFQRICRESD